MKNALALFPVDGSFSYCGFLDYMDEHFYHVHTRTTLDCPHYYCYDHDNNLIAYYNDNDKTIWAIKVANVA